MIDIVQAAETIVNSNDVESAFYKVASNLDEQWKTTLAREVNKQQFLKKLASSELNSDIKFDVIKTDGLSKLASLNISNTSNSKIFSKTASVSSSDNVNKKKQLIKAAMFDIVQKKQLKPNQTDSIKVAGTTVSKLTKEASENINSKLEVNNILLKQKEEKAKIEKIAQLKIQQTSIIEKIANLTTDESEFKTILKNVIARGYEDIVPSIINSSNIDVNYMQKVASVNISFNKLNELNALLDKYASTKDLL